MFYLVADSYLNAAILFNGRKLAGIEFESSYSCYNEFPLFSLKVLMDRFDLRFSDISNFFFIGEDRQKFNALLNLNLLELFDHNNRKEIIQCDRLLSLVFLLCENSDFEYCDVISWDRSGIVSLSYSQENITKTIFFLDENKDILFFTKLIYQYFGENFRNELIMAGFNEGLDLYSCIKDSCFDFHPDGRVYIKRIDLETMFEKYSDHEKFGYSVKKLIDDILIHLSNYMKYLTKSDNIVFVGEFCDISFGNRKMLQYIPYRKYYVDFNIVPTCYAEGALRKFFREKENLSEESVEKEKINKIILKLFEDFNSEDMTRISRYFHYMDDEVLGNIRDAVSRCSDIKMNFVLKDIAVSSSGLRGWGLFYFYFFGTFRNSGLPVIYNYKVMMFLERENNEWNISDIEFYVFDNLPILTLELSNCCNYKCIMCDTYMQKNRSFMTMNTFRNIIDSLEDFRVGTITPFWLGEPLLNPDFDNMVDYAFEKNTDNRSFVSFTINTNGSLLDKKKTDTILKNASRDNMNKNTFIRIHFSLDSVRQDTYSKIHGGGSCDKVTDNIRYFLKERKERGLDYPKVTVAIIVMKENSDEVGDFVDFWKKEFSETGSDYYITWDWPYLEKDAIYIRRLDCANQEEAEKMHYDTVKKLGLLESGEIQENIVCEENAENSEDLTGKEKIIADDENINDSESSDNTFSERIINTDSVLIRSNMDYFVRRPCPALWKTPIINWNGEVTTCCFDIDLQMKIGNINDRSLKELWDSEIIIKWRLFHLRGEFNKIKRCSLCHNINSPVMKNSEFIEYLLNIGKKAEVEKTHFLK